MARESYFKATHTASQEKDALAGTARKVALYARDRNHNRPVRVGRLARSWNRLELARLRYGIVRRRRGGVDGQERRQVSLMVSPVAAILLIVVICVQAAMFFIGWFA
jgi:hypothetical protein